MKFFKNNNTAAQARITFYDGVDRTESGKKLSSAAIKKSAKQTVNLCKRERTGMSFATFCLLLALVLIVLAAVEFFAAYRPYKQMEAKQKELADKQSQLDSLNGAMTDREAVQNEYREYNYENFPFYLVDREDVLAFIKERIFPYGKISNVSVSENTISLRITDIPRDSVDTLLDGIRNDDRVANLPMSTTEVNGDTIVATVSIHFKDAA